MRKATHLHTTRVAQAHVPTGRSAGMISCTCSAPGRLSSPRDSTFHSVRTWGCSIRNRRSRMWRDRSALSALGQRPCRILARKQNGKIHSEGAWRRRRCWSRADPLSVSPASRLALLAASSPRTARAHHDLKAAIQKPLEANESTTAKGQALQSFYIRRAACCLRPTHKLPLPSPDEGCSPLAHGRLNT